LIIEIISRCETDSDQSYEAGLENKNGPVVFPFHHLARFVEQTLNWGKLLLSTASIATWLPIGGTLSRLNY